MDGRVVAWKKGAHAGFTKWHLESERQGRTLCNTPINPRAPMSRATLDDVRHDMCEHCMAERRRVALKVVNA